MRDESAGHGSSLPTAPEHLRLRADTASGRAKGQGCSRLACSQPSPRRRLVPEAVSSIPLQLVTAFGVAFLLLGPWLWIRAVIVKFSALAIDGSPFSSS